MYLHIGNHKTIETEKVIGIFDLDHATVSAVTKKFLASAERRSQITLAAEELPKSFVLTSPNPAVHPLNPNANLRGKFRAVERQNVYLSQLSPLTLAQRTERKHQSYV